jgi:Threonyl-tRNA synthetase
MPANFHSGYHLHKIVVLPIAEEHNEYAKKIFKDIFKEGIKCEVDLRNQKINYKIREHSLSKVPFLLICGSKEIKDKSITIRKLGSEKQETKKFDSAIKEFKKLNNLPIN